MTNQYQNRQFGDKKGRDLPLGNSLESRSRNGGRNCQRNTPINADTHLPVDYEEIELGEDALEQFERNHPYLARILQNKIWRNWRGR